MQQRCFLSLEAPIQRVTGWDTHYPLAWDQVRTTREAAAKLRSCGAAELKKQTNREPGSRREPPSRFWKARMLPACPPARLPARVLAASALPPACLRAG